MDESLLPFFRPAGIVVVGASTSASKLGYGIARNLTTSGYAGAIHFVSQGAGELFGRTIHTRLARVPDPVDLAVLVIPAHSMPAGIRDCAARGIRAAIIISAGFREAGTEGAALEETCRELARATGLRLLGPNCIGIIDTHLPLDTSFLQPPMPPRGGIAFISHSGAFCAAIVDWSRRQGFGFSQIVSLGNQVDVSEVEVLSAVAEDRHTRVIVLYMEGVSDGVRFVRAAREVSRAKPIVAIKVGRSESGQRAASSHTAAMAGSDLAFDAAFARCGIMRAATTEQLFDWARALEDSPLPAGPRVAVLTNAGGPGVIAADALETQGMRLAALDDSTRRLLTARLPAAASVDNPVDMLASASPEDYASCLDALLKDTGVDAALVILPPPPMHSAESVAAAIIPIIRVSSKPAVVALLGSDLTEAAFEAFCAAHVPTYPFPERAATALAALFRRATYLGALSQETAGRPFDVVAPASDSTAELMAAYGIHVIGLRLATSPQEAATISRELGFPLVMKIASPAILHKSDVGGILLDVKDAESAASGYTHLLEAALAARPDAHLDGVHLQRQITGGQEVILGALRDPQFGALVMFGSGGVEAEALKDVAFALAPIDAAEADDLMRRTWAGRRLDGFRGIAPVDKSAARDALMRLSWLAFEHPEIDQVEINPLRVLPAGAFALDVRRSP